MKKLSLIITMLLSILVASCSKKDGSPVISIPRISTGSIDNIVIDPIKIDQPDFGQVTTREVVTQFLNIRNIGDGVIDPIDVSLKGIDADAFSLVKESCPALQPFSASVCTIRIQFNPANRQNRLYFAELNINGIIFPFSAELAIRASGTAYYQIYQGREFIAETVDLGVTNGEQVLETEVTLRHLSRSAVGNLPLIMTSPDFSLSRTACPAVEINGNGCSFKVSFNPQGKKKKTYIAPLNISSVHSVELKAVNSEAGGISKFIFLNENNEELNVFNFGPILIPEKKSAKIKIKNTGIIPSMPELAFLPNRVFTITNSSCDKPVEPNNFCELTINVTSANRAINNYNSKLTSGSNILEVKAFIYTTSQCNLGSHLDPEKLICVADMTTEIIPNGIRNKEWIPSPAPGAWSDWTYVCTQPNYELNELGDACIFKQRRLTISTEGAGIILGGESKLYNFNTVITLRAEPAQYYAFQGWEGDSCSGNQVTCTLTMNQVHNVRAVFFVPPLAVTPNPFNAYVNNAKQFSVTGGVGPYSYELVDLAGTVTTNGLYSGSANPSYGVIKIKDAQTRSVEVPVNIVGPFVASSTSITVVTDSLEQLGVSGGLPPYTFTRINGVGTDGIGGYNTGDTPGNAVVQVTDGLGSILTINVRVVRPLTVTPAIVAQEINKVVNLTFTNGVPPYSSKIKNDGVGSIIGNTYNTGNKVGNAVIEIKDGMNRVFEVIATVVDVFKLTKESIVMEAGGVHSIQATGGLTPYSYIVKSGEGSVSTSGIFTASNNPGTTVITVKDTIGTEKDFTVRIYYPLQINISNWTMEINQTKAIEVTGGASPYKYTLISGLGRITGNVFSSSVPTDSVVEVEDSVGNKKSVNFKIVPEFKLTKTNQNLLVNQNFNIVATGGLTPYSYSVVAGGKGSVNNTTGVYTAPNEETIDNVKVTDALGTEKNIQIQVVKPLSALLSASETYVSEIVNVSASFGLPPYLYRVSKGIGSISIVGNYTAPILAGEEEIEVSDAMGNKVLLPVKVYAKLIVTPMTKNLLVNQNQSIATSGGKTPLTFTVKTGPGTVSALGVYSSTLAGDAVIEVKDGLTEVKTLNYKVVDPLAVSPENKVILTNTNLQLIPSNGLSPYSYEVVRGAGTVSSSGLYSAPASADNSVRVRILDSMGNSTFSNINVIDPLTISNNNVTTTALKEIQLNPQGGLTPYIFSMQSGNGEVTTEGLFKAPATPGISVVKIQDSSFNEILVTFDVKEALIITPQSGYVDVNETKQYSATGGLPPYSFSILSGPGSINSVTGLLSAGSTSGNTVVMVTDAILNTEIANVQILKLLETNPGDFSIVINKTQQIQNSGGLSPYSYEVTAGAGTINSSGLYTAPSTTGTAQVTVKDSLNRTKVLNINIVPELSLVAANINVTANKTLQFTASGGLPPYSYSVVSGGGEISSTGLYTAGNNAGTATIKVKDSIDNEKTLNVSIVAPLTLLVAKNLNLLVSDVYSILATGGLEPYTYSVSGGGSITALGIYFASNTPATPTITIKDALNNEETINVKVVNPLMVTPTLANLSTNQTQVFSVSEGLPPYSYSLSGVGTFSSASRTYTAPASGGSASLTIRDAMGNQIVTSINVYNPMTITPSSTTVKSGNRLSYTINGGSGSFEVKIHDDAGIGSNIVQNQYYAGYTESSKVETLSVKDLVTGDVKYTSNITITGVGTFKQQIDSPEISNKKGFDVHMSELYMAVGKPLDNNTGSVDVYTYDGNNWNFTQNVQGNENSEAFGSKVKVFNNILAVGATDYNGYGRVLIYRHNGTNFIFEEAIYPPTLQNGQLFGSDIAIINNNGVDYVMVSSPASTTGGTDSGSVYIYRKYTNWLLNKTINGTAGDKLGYSIEGGGNVFAIGIPNKDHSSKTNAGEVLVQINDASNNWLDRTIRATSPVAESLFGSSVGVDKFTKIAVGAPEYNSTKSKTGIVYSYYKDASNNYVGEQIINNPFDLANDKFGKKVTLIQDHMVTSTSAVEGISIFEYLGNYSYLLTIRNELISNIQKFGQVFSVSKNGIVAGIEQEGEVLFYKIPLNPKWSTGADGDLVVESGQTVNIPDGATKNYNSVWVKAGGTLQINGSATSSDITLIAVQNSFKLDGTLRGWNGKINTTRTHYNTTFTDNKSQSAKGSGSGTSGTNGNHGASVIIYASSLTGNGTINTSGGAGGNGAAPSISGYSCAQDYFLVDVCGKKTCNLGICCTTQCTNVVSNDMEKDLKTKMSEYKNNILDIINTAKAGGGGGGGFGGGFCGDTSAACTQHTPYLSYNADAGGGGAGGNGGNIWIKTKDPYSGTLNIIRNGGAGGLSGGNGGSNGQAGSTGTFNADLLN